MTQTKRLQSKTETLWKRHTKQHRRTQLYPPTLKDYHGRTIHSWERELLFLERHLVSPHNLSSSKTSQASSCQTKEKSSLVSGNRPSKKIFIIQPPG